MCRQFHSFDRRVSELIYANAFRPFHFNKSVLCIVMVVAVAVLIVAASGDRINRRNTNHPYKYNSNYVIHFNTTSEKKKTNRSNTMELNNEHSSEHCSFLLSLFRSLLRLDLTLQFFFCSLLFFFSFFHFVNLSPDWKQYFLLWYPTGIFGNIQTRSSMYRVWIFVKLNFVSIDKSSDLIFVVDFFWFAKIQAKKITLLW